MEHYLENSGTAHMIIKTLYLFRSIRITKDVDKFVAAFNTLNPEHPSSIMGAINPLYRDKFLQPSLDLALENCYYLNRDLIVAYVNKYAYFGNEIYYRKLADKAEIILKVGGLK